MAWCCIALAWIVSCLMVDRICQPESSLHILDEPNHRSLHDVPKPRTGGVAIILAIYLATIALSFFVHIPIPIEYVALSGLLIAGVSFLDDCFGVKARYRLLAHFSAAFITIYPLLTLPAFELPGLVLYWSVPCAVTLVCIFVVWMLNLYNFMDGMDGFVSGMTIIGLVTFAIMGLRVGHEAYAAVCCIVLAATIGFWIFNYPPSHVFMGDVGACTLGFFVTILGIWGCEDGVFKPWFALLVFSPFIVDATCTLLMRLGRLEKVWVAQRNHFYHRILLRMGHTKALWCEYALMFSCALSALWLVEQPVAVQQWALAAWLAAYIGLGFLILRWQRSHEVLDKLN